MLFQAANQQQQHFYKNASIQIRSLVYKTRYGFKSITFFFKFTTNSKKQKQKKQNIFLFEVLCLFVLLK